LEGVFNTPSHHRVHHGSNAQYIDKNYGNLLIIWDRIFGTFEPEIEKVKFGLVKNVDTFNPSKITFMGWQDIYKNIKKSQNFNNTLYLFFGPPKTKN
jgi:sterol desaturase/sphingolipid hydroxylase (fatty acid hydroxylase superfamily)